MVRRLRFISYLILTELRCWCCDGRRYVVVGPVDVCQELATMKSLASMRRCNGANLAASSGPVLRQHLAHLRTLKSKPRRAGAAVCPPATQAHLSRCCGRCAGRGCGARSRRSLESNQRHACWKMTIHRPADGPGEL